MILEDKTLVVCGAGGGLGREVARLAVRDGAKVMLGARTESQLKAIAEEADPSGEHVAWTRTDLTDPASRDGLLEAAVERFGAVDALVMVAAKTDVFGGMGETEPEHWRGMFETNVVGTVELVKACTPYLERRGGGSVVLIGSQSSMLPRIPQIAYASSKGALMSAMYYMAQELGPKRIRVNTVVPTWMWGPPVESFIAGQAKERGISSQAVIDEIVAPMAIKEIPLDDDVAEAVVFLCSERARMITGQALLVNSGELMR